MDLTVRGCRHKFGRIVRSLFFWHAIWLSVFERQRGFIVRSMCPWQHHKTWVVYIWFWLWLHFSLANTNRLQTTVPVYFFSDYLRAVSEKGEGITHIQQTCPGNGKQSQLGAMNRTYLWCRTKGCGTVPLSGTPRLHFRTNNKYCADDRGTKRFLQNMPEKIRPHRRCWGVIFRMALVKGYRFTWGRVGIFRSKPPVFDRSSRAP